MSSANRSAWSAQHHVLIFGDMAGGQLDALWILPWDGNCFLTVAAWKAISAKLRSDGGKTKYFYVPMARLLESNEVLFDPKFSPKAQDEVYRAWGQRIGSWL
jgi:hypothetical protein